MFLGQMSVSAADLVLRRAALALLEVAAERERNSRCGRVCDITDFEPKLAEPARERI
jgi:hypothetical protein